MKHFWKPRNIFVSEHYDDRSCRTLIERLISSHHQFFAKLVFRGPWAPLGGAGGPRSFQEASETPPGAKILQPEVVIWVGFCKLWDPFGKQIGSIMEPAQEQMPLLDSPVLGLIFCWFSIPTWHHKSMKSIQKSIVRCIPSRTPFLDWFLIDASS